MKGRQLKGMTTNELVSLFVEIAIEQGEASLGGAIARYNRLYDQMTEVRDELKSRPDDQRRALLHLFDHPNAQVRLKAAVSNLALEPKAAQDVLRRIVKWKEFPQALDAGMILRGVEDGSFKPT